MTNQTQVTDALPPVVDNNTWRTALELVDIFDGRSQLIVYNHMWSAGAEWQCGGCTNFTSQFTDVARLYGGPDTAAHKAVGE